MRIAFDNSPCAELHAKAVWEKVGARVDDGEQPRESGAECHFRGRSSFLARAQSLITGDLDPIRGLVPHNRPEVLCFQRTEILGKQPDEAYPLPRVRI